jgi:pimeloyl-ACP methyl ester carboxylesterase
MLHRFAFPIILFVNMSFVVNHPVQHLHLSAAGVHLHSVVQGDGPPVLLLHGFPDHWTVWQPVMARLCASYRLMAPDLRGYNLSDKPESIHHYDIDCLVEDVRALIRVLGGRCTLVGHDWGGMLAWVVAARYPDEVSRLVILNAPHPCRLAQQLRDDPAQRAASDYVRLLTLTGTEERLVDQNCERLLAVVSDSGAVALSEHERMQFVEAWSQPGAMTAMLNWYRAANFGSALVAPGVDAVPDLSGASGQIAAPTLVLWGERDGSFPVACLDGLQQWVPSLMVHREPLGGHWLLREKPQLVAQLIENFLRMEHVA